MKKFIVLLLICLAGILCAACDRDGSVISEEDLDDTLKIGPWGECQELYFETEDGGLFKDDRVFVVNENGEKVLDVSDYEQTDILCGEVTRETRLIKTYTFRTEISDPTEDDANHKGYLYDYNYYNPFGELLLENSSRNLTAIVGGFGLTRPYRSGDFGPHFDECVFFLETGRCLGNSGHYFLTKNGLVMNGREHFESSSADRYEDCVFFNAAGEKVASHRNMYIDGYLIDDMEDTTGSLQVGWDTWSASPSLKEQYGFAPECADDSDANPIYRKVENEMPVDASLLIFRNYGNVWSCGLVDENGNIIREAQYRKIALLDENTLVAIGDYGTEILNRDDFSLRKVLPAGASYEDIRNAVD